MVISATTQTSLTLMRVVKDHEPPFPLINCMLMPSKVVSRRDMPRLHRMRWNNALPQLVLY